MQLFQQFEMSLPEYDGLVFISVARSPNGNGFIREVLIWTIADRLVPERVRILPSTEEKELILAEADRLWSDYWTVQDVVHFKESGPRMRITKSET